MKKKATASQRFSYWFDNLMSKGTASLLLILGVITAVVVITGGLMAVALGGPDGKGTEAAGPTIWFTLMHAINTGVLAKEEGTVAYLAVMTIVTLVGIFITSFLIGTISNGIKDKVTDLQRGRSRVIEQNHVVIIEFDENVTSIIEELVLAGSDSKDAVVIMADADKTEMEETIRDREVIQPAKIAVGDRAEILNFQTTISRLMVHSSQHPGMSEILSELLSFHGNEIYVEDAPQAIGCSLQELNLRLPNSTAIGIVRGDEPVLNPGSDVLLQADDQLILIAHEGGSVQLQERATDFVVSSRVTAKMMVQIAEERHKKAILNDLLAEGGSPIYMKPITRYVEVGEPVDFYTLGASAARYGEIAIGFKRFAADGTFEIEVNPRSKSATTFTENDDLIVVARG